MWRLHVQWSYSGSNTIEFLHYGMYVNSREKFFADKFIFLFPPSLQIYINLNVSFVVC